MPCMCAATQTRKGSGGYCGTQAVNSLPLAKISHTCQPLSGQAEWWSAQSLAAGLEIRLRAVQRHFASLAATYQAQLCCRRR